MFLFAVTPVSMLSACMQYCTTIIQDVISGETGWRTRKPLFKYFVTSCESTIISKPKGFKKSFRRKNWEDIKSVLPPVTLRFSYFQSNLLILSFVSPMCSKMQVLSLWVTVNILNLWENDIARIHLKDHEYIPQVPESNTATPTYLYSFRNKSHRGAMN